MRRLLLALSLLVALLPTGPAAAAETERIEGATRYETAAEVARTTGLRGRVVVLASGERFPDALSAPNLVMDDDAYRSPVLLTPRDALHPATRAALEDLDPWRVFVLGGWPAIGPEVERAIEAMGIDVFRIFGEDRYHTNAITLSTIYNFEANAVGTFRGLRSGVVVSGEAFPDALAAGPFAYDLELPVAITPRGSMSSSVRDLLTKVEQVVIVGGTGAVSQAVEDEIRRSVPVVRAAGPNRQATATAVADLHTEAVGAESTEVLVAKADLFPDALAATPLGGELGAPLLLAGAATDEWLASHPSVERVTLLGDVAPPRWSPSPGDTWHLQLQGDLVTDVDVDVYDVDLFDTTSSQIAALHGDGRRVVCYVSAGSREEWRPDADQWPAGALGEPLDGWPGERWVDVRSGAIRPVLGARLDLAAAKGCDGVDPDNVDGYLHDTGFPLAPADSLAFVRWLVAEGHERGLAVGLKNALDLVPELADEVDFAVNEQCVQYDECDVLDPYRSAGTAVFGVEYEGSLDEVCAATENVGAWLLADLALDGRAEGCP